MQIKILKSSDPFFWYAKHLGLVINVARSAPDCYWVRAPDGFLNFVLINDCEVVHEKY